MKLKVCTYNVRTEATCDGINNFPHRKEKIAAVIRAEKPDLIGFQEVMESGRAYFSEELTEYTVLGCGRMQGFGGEGVSLAFKKELFELVHYETFWLSASPKEHASTYGVDQSHCPRIAQVAHLVPKKGGKPILFCNTHLDHVGKAARLLGAMQLLQYFAEYKGSDVILTGDFNATPEAPEIAAFTKWQGGFLHDATAGLGGTFHGYGKFMGAESPKIDYIITSLPSASDGFVRTEEPDGGVYSSDHYPVFCELELTDF